MSTTATMPLDNQIKQYLPLLGNEEKQSLLSIMKSFPKLKEADTPYPRGPRPTIEQYNKELEEAEARIDAGFFTSHEDVLKESESW